MPIQRIPRYLLLIKEIMKNTSEDEEYTSWSLVFDQVDKICSQINNSSKSREQSMKILKIQDKISGLDDPIVAPHRSFIKEAKAIRIRATTSGIGKFKIKLYLFNDMILWTSRSNKFRGQLDLLGTKILSILPADILRANRAEDVLLFADDSVKSLRGFHILSQNSLSPLTIIFDNCETKMEWESLVSAQIFSSSRTIHAVLKAMRKISISKPMIPIAEIEEPQAEAGAPLVDEEKKEDI
jgi:FYVE/RhoGEF/PH domain-containing protein 5/6